MRTPSFRLVAAAAAATVLSACGDSRANDDERISLTPIDSVAGADGVAFGSPRERVADQLGEPADSSIVFENVRALAYPGAGQFGVGALRVVLVHPRDGMIRTVYVSNETDPCEFALGIWHMALMRKYGRLRISSPSVPADSACAVFARGQEWTKWWTDARGRGVQLSVSPERGKGVRLSYSTPQALDWEMRSVVAGARR